MQLFDLLCPEQLREQLRKRINVWTCSGGRPARGRIVRRGLDEVLLARGLMSPAGHAAWTGLVCAVLWRERLRRGGAVLNRKVLGAFATAVGLHVLWDAFNLLREITFVGFLSVELLSLLVAVVSLTLLSKRVREASREPPNSGNSSSRHLGE